MAVGFEFPGGWRNEKESLAAVVLQVREAVPSMLLCGPLWLLNKCV